MYTFTGLPHRGTSLLEANWFGDVERLFTQELRLAQRDSSFQPALDIVETEEGYEVRVDLPGVAKENLSVKVVDNILTIEAQSLATPTSKKTREVCTSERRIGKQYRALRLGGAVDEDNIHATYQDGVLTLLLPRATTPEAKSIQVH